MTIFGVDPDLVCRMHGQMSGAIHAQEQEIDRLRARNASLEGENRVRQRSEQSLNEEKLRLRRQLHDQASASASAVAKARAERDAYREKYEEELRRNGQLEREDARRERLIVSLQMQNDDLERRVEELEEDNCELHAVVDGQADKLLEAHGVVEGLLAAAKLEAEARVSTDPKTLRTGQAALAQSARGGISTEARIKALERAQRLLGKLPPDHEQRLGELRAEVRRKALPPAGRKKRRRGNGH